MDDRAFDTLTRALAGRAWTRRRATKALAALLLGGVVGAERWGEAEAKSKCRTCQTEKHGRCRKARDNSQCNGSGRCLNGHCRQPPTCTGVGESCNNVPTVPTNSCCSDRCLLTPGGQVFTNSCYSGYAGRPCYSGVDCLSGICVGYVCR
jgi:hypothetical protein